MTWNEIRSKCRRQSDYIITLFITNEISLFLTWLLVKTRLTPNQITIASILCSAACGLSYAFGWFITGSAFLFFSHVLDCTDGNLARAKGVFSPYGKWLDLIGDRMGEIFIFLGATVYFVHVNASVLWKISALLDAQLLLLYYYIVDTGLVLGISKQKQELGSLRFKKVHVKWGILEPVLYGFILLVPFGLLKAQIIIVFILTLLGVGYQLFNLFIVARKKQHTVI